MKRSTGSYGKKIFIIHTIIRLKKKDKKKVLK